MDKPDLTIAEAAENMNVSRRTVLRLMDRGELLFYRVGRLRRVTPDALAEFKKKWQSGNYRAGTQSSLNCAAIVFSDGSRAARRKGRQKHLKLVSDTN